MDKIITVTFPAEHIDWNILAKQRNSLLDLQYELLQDHKPQYLEALDTAVAVIEKLMESHQYQLLDKKKLV